MKKLLIPAALFSLVWNIAYAADCGNATTQAEINQCAGGDYKKADAQLNKVYKAVLGKADEGQQAQLKAAQNAWIKFRDLDCKFQTSGAEGGSIYPTALAGCLEAKASARAKELDALLHCKEGDAACVLAP